MEVCYYCGNPKESKEHVPPICFFPKGYRKELITVPSCHEHNSDKSDIDEYARTFFIGISASNFAPTDNVFSTSLRSLSRNNYAKYKEMFKNSEETIWKNEKTVSIKTNTEYLEIFITSLLKGIFYHEFKFAWKDFISKSTYFSDMQSTADEKINTGNMSNKFIKDEAKGLNKEVFYYNAYKRGDSYSIYMCLYDDAKITGHFYKLQSIKSTKE